MGEHSDTDGTVNVAETNGRSVTRWLPTYTLLPPDAGGCDFIYFAYSAGRIKIGYSQLVSGRIKQLATSAPFKPILVLVIPGKRGDEQDLHIRFHEDRLHGEWFRISDTVREYLRPRLCDIGRDTLDRAEGEFKTYCDEFVAGYTAPPKRSKRPLCAHGRPNGNLCAHCERERDLKVLEELKKTG